MGVLKKRNYEAVYAVGGDGKCRVQIDKGAG